MINKCILSYCISSNIRCKFAIHKPHSPTYLDYVLFTNRLELFTMRGVNSQINWDGGDAFVGACYPVGLCFNFCPYFIKIHKLLSFAVQEFSIFYTHGQKDRHKGEKENVKLKR